MDRQAVAKRTAAVASTGRPRWDEQTERELLEEFLQTRDRQVRNRLVELMKPLVFSLANKWPASQQLSRDDLRQIAQVGLLKAVERFDPSLGSKFSSFAIKTIMGELKRAYRDIGRTVKISRKASDLSAALVDEHTEKLRHELRREPADVEVAKSLEVDEKVLTERKIDLVPLSNVSDDGNEVSSYDSLGRLPTLSGNVEPAFSSDTRIAIGKLDPRSQRAVLMYFLDDVVQREIAQFVGCSQMHITRILAQAYEDLRKDLTATEPKPVGMERAVTRT